MDADAGALGAAAGRLAAAGCVAAGAEAVELAAAAGDPDELETYLARREGGEPLAWIVGATAFCGHAVRVDPGVYVPRAQSEELARRAGRLAALRRRGRVLDLCTGSGAVPVHLAAAAPGSAVVAVDIDPAAVRCARRNGVPAVLGDLGSAVVGRAFDVVTAVAPYVPTAELRFLPADVQRHEPRAALDGGEDGLDLVRRVVAAAALALRPGGWLLTEVGGDQDRPLVTELGAAGFDAIETWHDEEGDLRGVAARLAARR